MNLEKLLSQMTLEEKIGQLMQLSANFFGTESELTGPAKSMNLSPYEMASVGSCIGGRDADTVRRIQEEHLRADRNKIPLLFMTDVVHGYRTIYPIGLGLASSFDEELVTECTEMAAREAAVGGIHVTFSPMVDLARDPRWGRVMESSGEDPYLASVLGAAQVKAFQGESLASPENIAACVKHFAAYGACEAGKDYNDVEISERALRQFYLPSYKACVDAGVKMLMPSFNVLNGIPSTANQYLMNNILREEWGYDGVVISDWAAIDELTVHGIARDESEAALMAFESNCDIEMVSFAYRNHLSNLVKDGYVKEEDIDARVMRILRLKEELGLFDDPFHGADLAKGEKMYLCDKHRSISRRAAEESAVLLKNEGVLPFSGKVKRIALIGPYSDEKSILGPWSLYGKIEEALSINEAIKAFVPDAEVICAKGCGYLISDKSKDGFEEAISAAREADIAIVLVGEPKEYSGEGNCRTDIRLPGVQEELVNEICAVNKNTAVVLFNGRPLDLSGISEKSPAILEMWFPGTEGAVATLNLLFGRTSPSGKLPMSFPKSVGQCPIYYNRPRTGRPKTSPENIHQPYVSGYLDCGNLPLYFFGEGLSYTKFKYLGMKLDKTEITKGESLSVTVTVKNCGKREAKEVVQLYLCDKVSSAARPIQELIGFKKILIAPGETVDVKLSVNEKMLRFYNAKNEWVSEPGDFLLSVGYADHPFISEGFVLR